jgi:ankyrin repeat protein
MRARLVEPTAETVSGRLCIAIDAGDLDTVRRMTGDDPALLRAIVRPGSSRDYRPLTEAAVACQLGVLEFLIASGCDVNEDHNYPMFRTALYERCIPAMEMLVRHGADVNGVWDDYGPPLIATCEGMAPACMRWLLGQGARMIGTGPGKTRPVRWNTVAHAAYFHKWHPELLRIVLENGGDVNSHGIEGETPLHAAARHGDAKAVRLLLERGANPSLHDEANRLPIHVTKNKRVAEVLTRAMHHT